jgi:hypothetical protein
MNLEKAVKKIPSYVSLILGTIAIIILLFIMLNFFAWNNAGEIKVVQYPTGQLRVISKAGPFIKFFGDVRMYRQVITVSFGNNPGDVHKSAQIKAIPVMFNDAASATVSGIVRVNLPPDSKRIIEIRNQYSGGYEHFISNGVIPVVANAVKLSANLRSSQEAYMAMAPFQNEIEDQLMYGTYETKSVEKWVHKATGDSERVKMTEIVYDPKTSLPIRKATILEKLGCTITQCQVGIPDFDALVMEMINQRKKQSLETEVKKQEAIRAQQFAITAEANGKAEAMKAKWELEVIKIRAITAAEKERDSAKLMMDAAEYIKQTAILQGQGEAEKRRLILNADGALKVKLEAWLQSQQFWAEAFSKYQGSIVPQIQTGVSSTSGTNGATQFMEMMGMKAAKDLSLDMKVPKGATK